MTSDRDIYATALLFIKRHRERSIEEAFDRKLAMIAGEDEAGEAVWSRVIKAIEDLSHKPRGPDDALN